MSTIGRNDPCPCGSGKKYKRCCGARISRSTDFGYDRIRRLDTESDTLLTRFAKQHYGENAIEHAWRQFVFEDNIPFDQKHPEWELFLWWFIFNWQPEGKEKLAELFLSEKGSSIDSNLLRFIETTVRAPFSFFQTEEVRPGQGIILRDILRKREFTVTERSASTVVERGNILFARVVEMEGISFMMGCGTRIIPAMYLDFIMRVRSSVQQNIPSTNEGITSQVLLELENSLRETYFSIANKLEHPKMDIRNSDGDPLALHTLTYSIPSLDKAFHALKDLEQKVSGGSDAELLETAERDASGSLQAVYIHWLKRSKKPGFGDTTGIATLKISDSTLVVEVNSDRRSRLIQKEIAKRLGEDAVLSKMETKPIGGIIKEISERKVSGKAKEDDEHDRLLRESPEVKALMHRMMEKHWATWPDIPLPALRGMTPRQAAKNPEGGELLESLLMDFESRNRNKGDEDQWVDVERLRRELGLDSK